LIDGHPAGLVVREAALWAAGTDVPTLSAAALEEALEDGGLLKGVSAAVALSLPPGVGVDWRGVRNPYLRAALILILDALRAVVLKRADWEAVERVARLIAGMA
jgi:hypothetical protein